MARPARFTIEDIRAEALRIVDQEGLAALTMRRLASALGTGPMTIYNYVDDRLGLEALVVDAVAADIPTFEASDRWLDDVRTVALAMWTAVRRHPAAIPLVLTRRTSTATSLRPAEVLIDALRRGGYEGEQLLAAFRTITGFVMGIAQAELAGPLHSEPDTDTRTAAERIEALAGDEHPNLAELARIGTRSNPSRDFEAGLAIVLTGLQVGAARSV
jgi:AcrR family transcriptional regulator